MTKQTKALRVAKALNEEITIDADGTTIIINDNGEIKLSPQGQSTEHVFSSEENDEEEVEDDNEEIFVSDEDDEIEIDNSETEIFSFPVASAKMEMIWLISEIDVVSFNEIEIVSAST